MIERYVLVCQMFKGGQWRSKAIFGNDLVKAYLQWSRESERHPELVRSVEVFERVDDQWVRVLDPLTATRHRSGYAHVTDLLIGMGRRLGLGDSR